jgi:hypothetical protein
MYSNYQAIKTCKNLTYLCSYAKNPCCRYENLNDTNPCGNSDCLFWNEDYWAWEKPGLLKLVVCMLSQFLIQSMLLLFIETGLLKKLKYCITNRYRNYEKLINEEQINSEKLYGDLPKDPDVLNEEKRISMFDPRIGFNEIFFVDQLAKHYSDFMAVKGISFSLKKAECFGLLGKLKIQLKIKLLCSN